VEAVADGVAILATLVALAVLVVAVLVVEKTK
jgi:hypothetical protein